MHVATSILSNLHLAMKLLVSVIYLLAIGYIIGEERQKGGKIIGVRTTTMILLAAFTFSYISILIGDSPRMVTGIAGSVGFIGSGIIWKGGEDRDIGNLTTAVLILVLAGIGCLVALGFYMESLIITIVTYIVLHLYKKVF